LRVLLITSDLRMGGAERVALELVRALGGAEFRFTVAAVRKAGEMAPIYERAGAEVVAPLARGRLDPLAPLRTSRLIRRRRIDAVIVVNTLRNGLLFGLLGAALSGRRPATICWCHNSFTAQPRLAGHLRRYRRLGMLGAVVCVSREQRQQLAARGVARRGVGLVRNCVDVEAFAGAAPADLGLPAEAKVIVHVANVRPEKDFDTLLAAFGRVCEARTNARLVLAGRGTDGPEMRAKLAKAGLEGRVLLLGSREDIPAVLAAANVLALVSHSEVFPVAVLEGMAAGLPVVVTDLAVMAEFVTHGREGLKAPPGDAGRLAELLGELLDDDRRRRELGSAARARAGLFTPRRMAASFGRLLRLMTQQQTDGPHRAQSSQR